MKNIENFFIKQCSLGDIEKIKYISEKTFYETFSSENTEENLSYEQIESEVKNNASRFYIVEGNKEVIITH